MKKKKIEQAKARIRKITSREKTKERKLETRCKIILGSLIMKAAKTDASWNRGLRLLIDYISHDNDRRAFEHFTLPAAPENIPMNEAQTEGLKVFRDL